MRHRSTAAAAASGRGHQGTRPAHAPDPGHHWLGDAPRLERLHQAVLIPPCSRVQMTIPLELCSTAQQQRQRRRWQQQRQQRMYQEEAVHSAASKLRPKKFFSPPISPSTTIILTCRRHGQPASNAHQAQRSCNAWPDLTGHHQLPASNPWVRWSPANCPPCRPAPCLRDVLVPQAVVGQRRPWERVAANGNACVATGVSSSSRGVSHRLLGQC